MQQEDLSKQIMKFDKLGEETFDQIKKMEERLEKGQDRLNNMQSPDKWKTFKRIENEIISQKE